MRILIVSQYFWPENFRINDLVSALIERGHTITVLTGKPNYPSGKVFEDFGKQPSRYANYAGAQVVRVPMLARGQGSIRLLLNYITFALSASVVGPWKLRGQNFDAIFGYEPSPITVGLPAIVLRKVKSAPLVFWVLDLWPQTLDAIGIVKSPWGLNLVGKLVSYIYERCDLILGQSKSFVPEIAKYAGKSARIAYFPSWAESLFSFADVGPSPLVPPFPQGTSVLFAGNVGEAQDFPAILGAAEQLKDHPTIRWLIVGDGRKYDWVRSEVVRRGLSSCVLLFGRHPVNAMPSFFVHATALLVSLTNRPIFALTIPGKLQSYLASGLPVLAMLDGEGANIVKAGGAGFTCSAGDSLGLAKAVLQLAASSTETKIQMGKNGMALAEREFDRNVLVSQLEAWLQELGVERQAKLSKPRVI